MTQTVVRESPTAPRRSRAALRDRMVIAGFGVAGGGISVVGIGVPSFWGDEAASVLSAERPLPSLFAELAHVDAVHGLYYLFLHFWIAVAGSSETAVRFPSAVAAGFAVAGTVALGRELIGRRAAVFAGFAALAMPELTRMAIEGRSYAFGMAAAVWIAWYLVRLVRRRESRWMPWAIYAAAVGLSIWLFLYLGLMVVVHLALILLERPPRRIVVMWTLSVLVAGPLATPILILSLNQQHQIQFLAYRDYATFNDVLVRQWFGRWYVAVIAWTLIAAGAIVTLVRGRTVPALRRRTLLVYAWLVLPGTLLLAGNAWLDPMYNMRYLAFCVPAVALAVGVGIDRVTALVPPHAGRVAGVMLVAVLLLSCVPGFIAQRGAYAKDGGSDLREIATAVSDRATPGDAIVFDESVKPRRKPRLALDLYPADFAGLDDIGLSTPFTVRVGLWDKVTPLDQLRPDLADHPVVWFVESRTGDGRDLTTLESFGYRVAQTTRLHRTTLYELTETS
jgi:mannosyltransferase